MIILQDFVLKKAGKTNTGTYLTLCGVHYRPIFLCDFQDEYISEGIDWRSVDFVDNAACLDLISGRPTGLLNLIDEESR